MPYQNLGFATPEAYAAEIKRKEQAGQTLTNQAAADIFKAANPNLFQQQQTTLRSLYPAASYNQGQVGLGGATFQSGQIPGTTLTGGTHYVNDQTALQNAIREQLAKAQGGGSQLGQNAGQNNVGQNVSNQAQNITNEFTPDVQNFLSQIRSYISQPPQTVDQMMQGDYYQSLKGAADAQTADQMMQAKAQLAGAGGLFSDDTRAASRFSEEGERASARLNQIIPHLVQASQSQRGMGLNELIQGFNAFSGLDQQYWQRGMTEAQTMLPYTRLTIGQKAELANTLIMNVPALQGYSPEQIMEWLDSSGTGV